MILDMSYKSLHKWLFSAGFHITLSRISSSIKHSGQSVVHKNYIPSHLNQVYHVPSQKHNLTAVHRFVRYINFLLIFRRDSFFVKDKSLYQILLQGNLKSGLYSIQFQTAPPTSSLALIGEKVTSDTSHNRLEHPSRTVISQLLQQPKVFIPGSIKHSLCSSCQAGKSHRLPFIPSIRISTKLLQLLHSDLWEPASIMSLSGNRYYIGDVSRFVWIYPLFQNQTSSLYY